jgi:hypothetical protein
MDQPFKKEKNALNHFTAGATRFLADKHSHSVAGIVWRASRQGRQFESGQSTFYGYEGF